MFPRLRLAGAVQSKKKMEKDRKTKRQVPHSRLSLMFHFRATLQPAFPFPFPPFTRCCKEKGDQQRTKRHFSCIPSVKQNQCSDPANLRVCPALLMLFHASQDFRWSELDVSPSTLAGWIGVENFGPHISSPHFAFR